MGIFCELSLMKPSDGCYQPGQSVSGKIKYAVDEPTEFEKITTSLKGNGFLILRLSHHGNNRRRNTYRASEVYVDIDNILQNTKVVVPVGCYEIDFNFNLPTRLPSSLNVRTFYGRYRITCKILYYIRIKFERPGLFAWNKHFKKEITIISGGVPRLPREPTTFGDTKTIRNICFCKKGTINIKANINNSVIPIGGKIELNYEVVNNSSVSVKSVEIKLVEVLTFKAVGIPAVQVQKDVPDTDCKTTSVNSGDTQSMPVQINVISDIHSLENATIVSRDYYVRIITELPMPHINAVLDVPVQIGAIDTSTAGTTTGQTYDVNVPYNDPPPSYWEAMGETRKEDDYGTDDDNEG